MSPRHKSKLWEHFTRTGNGKVKCSHCCREMSVKNKSTCSLIRHMIRLHPSINITKADGTTFVSQDSGPKETKQRSSTWEHFTHALEDRVKCKYCEKELSIKNESACSLIRHLLKKHPSVEIHRRTRYSISSSDLESFDEEDDYDDIGGDNVDVGDDNDGSHIGVDDYNEERSSDGEEADGRSAREEQLWSYFELETGGRARCVLCRAALPTHSDTLGSHLESHHSELAAELTQESDAELEGEDNELISEIVYLEDGNDENEKKYTTAIDHDHDQISDTYKRRKRHRDDDAPPEKYRLPKVGRNSVSSEDDRPVLLVAAGKKDNEEADAFSKYLMQLLKSLPKHIQTKLQMEIVNVVMKAKMEYEAKQQEREDEEKNAASSAKDSRYSVMVARNEPLRRILSRKSETDTKKNSNMLGGTTETEIGIATEDDAMTSEVNLPTTYLHSL